MPNYAPGPTRVARTPGCNFCRNGALKFMYIERSMFPYNLLCTFTLNEFAGKMDDLGKKDGGFHAQNVGQRASEALKRK